MALSTSKFSFELGGVAVSCGVGELARLPEICRELGMSRVLLVSDSGLVTAGHSGRAFSLLADAGLEPALFTEIAANPTSDDVERGHAAAREFGPTGLVALGGGSALDVAKGINFLYTQGGRIADYWGDGLAKHPMLPAIGIPTTAGTGSEAQRFAVIADAQSHRKMACGDRKARFRHVLLDPTLLATAPRTVVAAAGLDALSHAVESYVSRARTPFSQMLAKRAFELISAHFAVFLADRQDHEAAEAMMLGAHLAGAAIEASMLGAAHACANPVTAHYATPHGSAVALFLPSVVRFNSDDSAIAALYHQLCPTGDLAVRLEAFRNLGGLPKRLRDLDVAEGDLPQLAEEAATQWTGRFNPRLVATADLLHLYREAF